MSDTPTFLGISMGPQKNRRLFVAVTYAILVACMAATPVVPFWGNRIQTAWGLLFFLSYIMGNHLLFGSTECRSKPSHWQDNSPLKRSFFGGVGRIMARSFRRQV